MTPANKTIDWEAARDFLRIAFDRKLRGRHAEDRDDLVSESLVRCLRYVTGSGAPDNLEAFLIVVANRTWIDYQRRRMTRNSTFLQDDADAPASTEDPALALDAIRIIALTFFRETNAPCLELATRFFAEQDWRRVGNELGVSHDSIRQRWARCLEKLRSHVRQDRELSAFLKHLAR